MLFKVPETLVAGIFINVTFSEEKEIIQRTNIVLLIKARGSPITLYLTCKQNCAVTKKGENDNICIKAFKMEQEC